MWVPRLRLCGPVAEDQRAYRSLVCLCAACRRVVCPRPGTKYSRLVMVVCVRVRVARVVRVSESALLTLVNTLRSSEKPLSAFEKSRCDPPSGLVQVGIRTEVEPIWSHPPILAPVSLPSAALEPLPCAHLAQNPPSLWMPNGVFYPVLRHRDAPTTLTTTSATRNSRHPLKEGSDPGTGMQRLK